MAQGRELYRVLHLIASDQRRGAEIFATQLATSLEAQGVFENGLCSLYGRGDDGLPTSDLPTFKLEGNTLAPAISEAPKLLVGLSRVLRHFQPDIIIAHGGDTLKYAATARYLYRRGRLIYRNIGTASFWARSARGVRLNKLLLKTIDAVVSVSEHTRDDFIRLYGLPPKRVVFIPNGVDVSALDSYIAGCRPSGVRKALGLPQDRLVLVSVGSLSPEKGFEGLLRLIADMKGAGFRGHLLLVGDGPLRQRLECQVHELGLTGIVRLLGTRSDVPRLLTAADLFVLPSKSEGMPAVLIEAGLAGLASVAFDVGGVAEVVEHQITGLLVPPGDFRAMGNALRVLLDDPERRARMGEAARQRCREVFDMRNVSARYEELFLRVLNSPAGRRDGQPQEGTVSH